MQVFNEMIQSIDTSSELLTMFLPHNFWFYLFIVLVLGFIGIKAESKIVTPLMFIILIAIFYVGGYATAPM